MSCVLGKYFYHTTHIQENAQVSRVFPRTAPAPRPSRERCPNRRRPSCPLRLAARLRAAAVFISDAVMIFPPRTPGAGGRAARAASASEGRAAEVAVATAHCSVVCVQAAAFPTRCPWASEGFAGVRCARRDDANVLACGSWWTQVPVVCAGAWACGAVQRARSAKWSHFKYERCRLPQILANAWNCPFLSSPSGRCFVCLIVV